MLKLVRISDDDKSKMSLSYPASACCAFATEYLGDSSVVMKYYCTVLFRVF